MKLVCLLPCVFIGWVQSARLVENIRTKQQFKSCVATGSDAEALANSSAEGIVLPSCERIVYPIKTVAKDSYEWCNDWGVKPSERAPKKIQGLYWLKGLDLPDVMACFSAGKWDSWRRTLSVEVWSNFMFRDNYGALSAVSALYTTGLTYHVKYKDDYLTEATISSSGGWVGMMPVMAFNFVSSFPLIEIEGSKGLRWERPSYFGVWPFRVKVNEYEAWKVMDGDGEIMEENHATMVEAFEDEDLSGIIRFPKECPDEDQEALGTVRMGSETCDAGIFVTITKQPTLGLIYQEPLGRKGPFAKFRTSRGCSVEYHMDCENGYLIVYSEQHCPMNKRILKLPKASPEGAFKDYWEVCADSGGVLSTTMSLVDQTWGTEIPGGTHVDGCIRVLGAHGWPELDQVRGSFDEQKVAIDVRKKEVGGCPLYRSEADHKARAHDFPDMSKWLGAIQYFQHSRAETWKYDTGSMMSTFGNYVDVAFLGVGAKGNRTTGFTVFAQLNCGEPAPFVGGPQVFRHADVAGLASDPNQPRVYSTATVPQSESCFQKTIALFMSSGSPEHTELRQLLDLARFSNMHETEFPEVTARIPDKATGEEAPTEKDVAREVLKRVMMAVWGETPSSYTVDSILPYIDMGKLCIFGQTGQDMFLLRSSQVKQVVKIRQANAEFGMTGPTMAKVMENLPKFPSVQKRYTEAARASGKTVEKQMAMDVGDAVLFAGMLGTSDMATKCIQYQWRDHNHVAMYRKDKVKYLHELMRYDGAVTSFTTAMKEDDILDLEGVKVPLKAGTPVQMSIGTANRDEAVFKNPSLFDPERSDIDEQVAWNGRLKDVIARNYSAAPRYCPGYSTSIKIATQVCDHYTQFLSPYSDQVETYISGTVEILKPGDWYGRKALVSHFDFRKNKHCLIDKTERPVLEIGCYKSSELKVVDQRSEFPRTWEDEAALCPAVTNMMASVLSKSAFEIGDKDSVVQQIKERIFSKDSRSEHLKPDFADEFTGGFYTLLLHLNLRKYITRYSENIVVPTRTGQAETFRVGDVVCPNVDIDDKLDNFLVSTLKDHGWMPNENCVQNVLRELPFEDRLFEEWENTWPAAFQGGHFKRKKDWILAFYSMYTAGDGSPVWPKPELDFAQLFLKGDLWDDQLEMAIAFDLIGSHRVKAVKREHKGETLEFMVELNPFSALTVREGFGIYQGDMYFTSDGLPAIIELANGKVVEKGDSDWQYWKYVWRSALLTIITIADHLHTTHFKTANLLARVSRVGLSPDHPFRRLTSIFTFGTIGVNIAAMHALAGPDHALHRSSPFADFVEVSRIVPASLPDLVQQHAVLHSEELFNALPPRLQQAPYYQDGKLLFRAIAKLVRGYFKVYDEMCDKMTGRIKDAELQQASHEMAERAAASTYKNNIANETTCEQAALRFTSAIWTVTGWHRHVGTVADYYVDPDLASFSWKDGEAFPRPQQTLILSVIAAFTGTVQPKLTQNYTHLFSGITKEEEALKVWQEFQDDLQVVKKQVQANNVKRGAVSNFHADPDIVECSVAV